jgi:hypothetical protein
MECQELDTGLEGHDDVRGLARAWDEGEVHRVRREGVGDRDPDRGPGLELADQHVPNRARPGLSRQQDAQHRALPRALTEGGAQLAQKGAGGVPRRPPHDLVVGGRIAEETDEGGLGPPETLKEASGTAW